MEKIQLEGFKAWVRGPLGAMAEDSNEPGLR